MINKYQSKLYIKINWFFYKSKMFTYKLLLCTDFYKTLKPTSVYDVPNWRSESKNFEKLRKYGLISIQYIFTVCSMCRIKTVQANESQIHHFYWANWFLFLQITHTFKIIFKNIFLLWQLFLPRFCIVFRIINCMWIVHKCFNNPLVF